jgi:membrane-bound ClpP family serine protease
MTGRTHQEGLSRSGVKDREQMESIYIIALWLLGIVLVVVGWYIPDAGILAWLGLATLIFGAALAFRRSHAT